MRLNGLWRRGAGTPEDPDNGRLVFRLIGFHPSSWSRRALHLYPEDLHPTAFSYVRLFFNEFIRRYRYEICMRCSRAVGDATDSWWAADDWLWKEVVGQESGILCPRCFTKACRRRRIFVYWRPIIDSSRDERWCLACEAFHRIGEHLREPVVILLDPEAQR